MKVRDVLTPEQEALGYYLFEDDHTVYLQHRGRCVAVFSAIGATRQKLREAANEDRLQRLREKRSGLMGGSRPRIVSRGGAARRLFRNENDG